MMPQTLKWRSRDRKHCVGVVLGLLLIYGIARAQEPIDVQLFLPGGWLPEREIHLIFLDAPDLEIKMMTDRRGRFRFPASAGADTANFRIPARKQVFESDEVWKSSVRGMKLVPVFLQPAKGAPLLPKETIDFAASDARAPAEARTALERARNFLAEKKLADAVGEFTEALTRYPRYLRAINELGELYIRLNRLFDAVDVYQYARRFNASEPVIGMNLSRAYRALDRNEKAQEVLEELLKARPESGAVRILHAEVLMNSRQYDAAAEQLRLGLADLSLDAAQRAEGHMRLGFLHLREERYQAALSQLQKAVDLDPKKAPPWMYLGTALSSLNRYEEAEPALRKAIELGGARVAQAQLVLGELYFNTKKFDLALAAFEQYLKDLPSAANAAQVRGYIDRIKARK